MSDDALSLIHRVRRPTQASHGAPPLLLLLHGIGSHEQDLMGLAPHLDPRFFVVGARAPHTLQPGAFAWFHVEWTADGPIADATEAKQSMALLNRFIDEVTRQYTLDAQRVYLMGFSQGAILSLALALTEPKKVAGEVAMSGRLLTEALATLAAPEALAGLPIFVAHGTQDQVLSIRYGRDIQQQLEKLPVALTYHEYPMAHEVSGASLSDIAAWLSARLDGPRREASQ